MTTPTLGLAMDLEPGPKGPLKGSDAPDWFKEVPSFDGHGCPQCLKCGWPQMRARFSQPTLETDWPEHLIWTCGECGASRLTRCADYKLAPQAEQREAALP